MTPRELQALILATPACAPHIHTDAVIDSGTATGWGGLSVTDSSKNWGADALVGMCAFLTDQDGGTFVRRIVGNSPDMFGIDAPPPSGETPITRLTYSISNKLTADDARAKDQAIADALAKSGALTQIVSRKIGEDDVLRELGISVGDALLTKLETLALTESKIKRALRLLGNNDLDVGNDQTQAMIDALPMPVSKDEKTALKNMALRTVTVSGAQVSTALRGPWGDE